MKIADNTLYENDIAITPNNYNPACTAPAHTETNIQVVGNWMRNTKVSNVGGPAVINGQTYYGYQAGIDDVGNNDTIAHNTIVGAGYKSHTTPGGPFVLPIDTVSFPTIDPHVYDNTIEP